MLTWTKIQDGQKPNGTPSYKYETTGKDGCRYRVVWACDRGFGYVAYGPDGEKLHPGPSICWGGSLKHCKASCEEIEATRPEPAPVPAPDPAPPALVPNWAGEFATFNDWVNKATRALANKTCESSGCTMPVPAMCVDTKGRRCFQGSDFERARREGCFPVRYFWDCKVA
jgi:hypothetical protein